jgi:aspartyl-tRNA(Asn)/glutamyl-tRNA(Gln) amidotransferase subunit C
MSAGFSREQVAAVAALANLELTDEEVDLFARQLGDILKYAELVQQIDTTGVPPTASVSASEASAFASQTDRADEPIASLDRALALANAPDPHLDAGLFKVPRVIG